MNIREMLQGRENQYGAFERHADIAQRLKEQMSESPNWDHLDHHMKEALEMIQHKIARILNGDPTYADSWVDIAGYAQLVVDLIEKYSPKKAA